MSFTMTPDIADRLLDRLSNDEDFRQLFQSDPREALRQIGHPGALSNAQEGIWSCLKVDKLADATAIGRARKEYLDQLTNMTQQFEVPHFSAMKTK